MVRFRARSLGFMMSMELFRVVLVCICAAVVSGLVIWEPSIHDGARTEIVTMLRNCSAEVIIASMYSFVNMFARKRTL
jgi:hypothetical protein